MPIAWSRPEPFGAWIRLDDATLVAVDNALAERLRVPHGYAPPGAARPLEIHVAVTSRCPLPCDGCYLDARPDGDEPPLEAIIARLEAARDNGASLVAFGGGEPLTRRDLDRIAAEARRLGLVPVLTTSGVGLTEARARELRGFAQINVSHDGAGEGYTAVRGFDGRALAEQAIRALVAAGIPTGVNMVLTSRSFPAIEATCDLVADLGAVEVQLLRYKPAGRGDDAGYAERRLTTAQIDELWPAIARIVAARRIRVRIDCAMVPLISRGLLAAVEDAPKALAALGVFGCEAGRHLGALRVDGSAAPCSLFSVEARGLIQIGSGPARAAAVTDRLRAYHASPAEPCGSCALLPVCRGGCQIVSLHAGAVFAPDPECPRVLEHM